MSKIVFHLNKLVRDKLPNNMRAMGQMPKVRTLEGSEKVKAQVAKLLEEVQELDVDSPTLAEELADVKQIVSDLEASLDKDIETLRIQKLDAKGGFSEGQFVTTLTLRADDPWVDYYRNDQSKYPEEV